MISLENLPSYESGLAKLRDRLRSISAVATIPRAMLPPVLYQGKGRADERLAQIEAASPIPDDAATRITTRQVKRALARKASKAIRALANGSMK